MQLVCACFIDRPAVPITSKMIQVRTRLALALVVCISMCSVPASTQVFVSEGFDYDVGALDGQDGGTGFDGAWTAELGAQVIALDEDDELFFDIADGPTIAGGDRALQITGNDNNIVSRALETSVLQDEVYVSFLFRWDAGTQNNGDFAAWWHDNKNTGSHPNKPNIGLNANGSGNRDIMASINVGGGAQYSTDIEIGETYLIVGRFYKSDPGAGNAYDQFDLWVNPDLSEEGIPQATSSHSGAISDFDVIGMRSNRLDADDVILVDSLTYGDSFFDVVQSSPFAVPEPSPALLVGLALAGIAVARRPLRYHPPSCTSALTTRDA
jgi:hypothetical protein